MAGGPGFDLCAIANKCGCPALRALCEGRESEMSAQVGPSRCVALGLVQAAQTSHARLCRQHRWVRTEGYLPKAPLLAKNARNGAPA